MQKAEAVDTCFQSLHEQIIPIFQFHFPKQRNLVLSTHDDVTHGSIANKWHHRRCFQTLAHRQIQLDLRTSLKAWFHWARFSALQRQQQRNARRAKAQRFATLCTEASMAAQHHNTQELFQIINKHSPKRPLTRARLKTEDGKIADQYMAHALTVQHVRQQWQGTQILKPMSEQPAGVPMTIQDIERAIMELHPNKTVASPFLPAIIWKSAPRELASLIHHQLTIWWSRPVPFIPPEWRDAWLFFIPKPGKDNTHPSQLRPISLMEPIGKLIMGLITDQLKAFHARVLCSEPQFGFLPKRSALDAITRVISHCNRVRTQVSMQRRTFARQYTAKPGTTFCGGLQMLLDLKHAFDTVDRDRLFRFLHRRGTPSDLLHIVSTWHMDTHYNLIHQGRTTQIPVTVGLRQGCKAAPILWVLFMSHFVELLQEKIEPAWLDAALTMYADDVHVGAQFNSLAEYRQVLTRVGCILDVIESMQLKLSYDKTFVILATAGSNVSRALKGTIERSKKGATILIPRAGQAPSPIPLRATGKYLGIIVSYGQYELQTWQHRLKAARTAFARLRCWFKNKQFQVHHRVHLWMVCVHTILTYGLSATNVTMRVLHEYQQIIYQMMRTVLHDHAYVSHNTHQQVFHNFGLAQPLDLFAQHVTLTWRRLQRRAQGLHATDFLHHVDWTHLPGMLRFIQCMAATNVEAPISPDVADPIQTQAKYRCSECAFQTHSIPNLRRHQTQVHGRSQYRTSPVNPLEFALSGKPQCRNCLAVFTTWRRFFIHIERNCCQAMEDASGMSTRPTPEPLHDTRRNQAAESAEMNSHLHPASWGRTSTPIRLAVETKPFWPVLREVATTSDFQKLLEDAQIGEFLTHHCMHCEAWCNRCQELHSHYRLHHSQHMPGVLARGAQITHKLTTVSPCELCHKPYKKSHSCPVATQVASLQLHGVQIENQDEALRTCIICNQVLPSMAHLHQHLGRSHDLQIPDWCPSRDSLQDSDACAHCGAAFATRSGLRRHILDGRCELFDPGATAQPLDAATKWSEVLQQGELTRATLTPAQRQDLTLVCQLCGQRYSRQNDLGAHLQHAHSNTWQASQESLRFLIQAVQAKHGCQCNPSCHGQGRTHICMLLRQFSMIYMLSSQDVLVPTQYHQDLLNKLLRHIDHLPLYQTIHDTLYTRQFEDLWQQPGLSGLLSQWCIQCGQQHHPAALVVHHWQMHGEDSQWAAQIKYQITASMLGLQDQDTMCTFCGLPINLHVDASEAMTPDRFIAMQIDFNSNCPVVHQAAQLLLPTDGRNDAGVGSERPGPPAIVQRARAIVTGSQPLPKRQRRGTSVQTSQTRGGARRHRSPTDKATGAERHDGHDEGDGQTGATARTKPPTDAQAGLIRFLRPGQPSRSSSSAGPGSGGMERSSPEESR